jgi:hypothetical protein
MLTVTDPFSYSTFSSDPQPLVLQFRMTSALVPAIRAANFPHAGHFTVVAVPTVIYHLKKKAATTDITSFAAFLPRSGTLAVS